MGQKISNAFFSKKSAPVWAAFVKQLILPMMIGHREDFCNTYRLKKGSLVQSLTADWGIVCRQHQYTRKHHESSHWPRCWGYEWLSDHTPPKKRYGLHLFWRFYPHSVENHPIRWSARSCFANETNCLLCLYCMAIPPSRLRRATSLYTREALVRHKNRTPYDTPEGV